MNILIPHKWLLDHLETSASPQEIQRTLSLSGPSVERIYERFGDSVYDIEVTTNRVDSMSVRGIAREAATILKQFGIEACLKPLELEVGKNAKPQQATLPLPKIINDPKLNKRTTCVILSNIKRTPTPEWMEQKLQQVDIGVHDSVIDITNYVTHDLGHPCHAFDYEKLMATGGVINIVQAKKGEKFQTLDGLEFETVGGEVVFKNGRDEIIDLPSIKGTANTSIDQSTQNVLLLLESIQPKYVRFASMTHAIRTTAAQLMEKDVDPNLAELVLRKGVELYQQLCEAKIASEIYDDFPMPRNPRTIVTPIKKVSSYLGIELENTIIKQILEDLGCKVEISQDSIMVTPPSFRNDLEIPADIVEEIARIYGYHKLPSLLMPTAIPLEKPAETNFVVEDKIKHFLAAIGWQEIYSYSMVSEELAMKSGQSPKDHLKLSNPLTDDRVYLRRSLAPSLIEIIEQNSQRKVMSVFELAKIYQPVTGKLPIERMMLTLVSNKNYLSVKGDFEALLDQFFVREYKFSLVENQSENQAELTVINPAGQQTQVAVIEMRNGYTIIDVDLLQLIKVAKKHPNYQQIPKTSSTIEELTFTDVRSNIGDLINQIKETNRLVKSVKYLGSYKENHSFAIEYWDQKHTLTAEEVSPVRKEIVARLSGNNQARLVGKLAD
ncbi:MAG: phenylalanine--tRNA ligase subunit beta [Patescibacteria group bacterium]